MDNNYKYANEQNSLMIVALLKAHGIRKVVVSPGTTNICITVSMMHDGSFEMYSCIDERSAAYMACGIAAETGEPVVIMCTEATASRDYIPGLTEAYHRKLPILAITGMHSYSSIGHLEPQVIDRSVSPTDCLRLKVNLPELKDDVDVWDSMIKINKAILELKRHGGGPVHINLPWPNIPYNFSVEELPKVRVIKRFYMGDKLPAMPSGKVVIFVGSHLPWRSELVEAVDTFCAKYNSAVFCGLSSKYYGKFSVQANLFAAQKFDWPVFDNIDLVIHLGEETSDEFTATRMMKAKATWRVSEDGELRDTFRNLQNVFEMPEVHFFETYNNMLDKKTPSDVRCKESSYYADCINTYKSVYSQIPELPFSNFYVASKIMPRFPENSVVHFGASNTIRAWSAFQIPRNVRTDSNMGCRGIDGAVSASVGISLMNKENICFCILGDLTFFYDISVLGNRHIGNNYRILIINNGGGNIFKHRGALGYRIGDDNSDLYISAGGHFGNQSKVFVRQFAEALGYKYISASNKSEFDNNYDAFLSPSISDPIVFEVFTEDEDERVSFEMMYSIKMDQISGLKRQAKKVIGDKGARKFKELFNK